MSVKFIIKANLLLNELFDDELKIKKDKLEALKKKIFLKYHKK